MSFDQTHPLLTESNGDIVESITSSTNLNTSQNINKRSTNLIRSMSSDADNAGSGANGSKLLDMHRTVSVQKSDYTDDASEYYMTQGGGKIYIDSSYMAQKSHLHNDELNELRKSTQNNLISIQMDPKWTPFARYRFDLYFIAMSILMDLFAIISTWLIFIFKDDYGNEKFGTLNSNESHDPYPSGYEILRCLFIPLFVYIFNRILHFVISKSIKHLYFNKELYLFQSLRNIVDINRHFVDIFMIFIFGIYIFIICSYWHNEYDQNDDNVHFEDNFDKFLNESIWLNASYMDTKSITYFMLISFLIIYFFDIYCSMHYAFIYVKFKNYVRYNSMRQSNKNNTKNKEQNDDDKNYDKNQKVTNMNLQNNTMTVMFTSDNLKEFDEENTQKQQCSVNAEAKKEEKEIMHINKSIISTNSIISDPTNSILEEAEYIIKEYNPHIHADIGTLKVNEFKESVINEYESRHYSLFEDETKEQSKIMSSAKRRRKNRKRSHSESDLRRTHILKSFDSEFVSPIKRDIGFNGDKDENKNALLIELREKINFLKATLFAKQSCLDRFKLDLNEQSFFIENMKIKIQRIEKEKQELEQQVMDKNDELDEKNILLQVAEGTKNELNKECSRLRNKLQQITKANN